MYLGVIPTSIVYCDVWYDIQMLSRRNSAGSSGIGLRVAGSEDRAGVAFFDGPTDQTVPIVP